MNALKADAPAEPDDSTIAALDRLLRRLMWVERVWLREYLRDFELDVAPFMVLGRVAHLGGTCTISVLVEQLDQRNATMTGHIDRLEDKGLVTRKFGRARDRRKVNVHLTARGQAFLDRVKGARYAHLRCMYASLSEPELAELVRLLERCLSAMEEAKW